MPTIRKLDEDEVRGIEKKRLGVRKATEVEYDRYLANFAPGEYGEVTLDPSDKRLTVRNRFKAAASRHAPPLALTFQRTRGDVLRFHVEAGKIASSGSARAAKAPRAARGRREEAPAAERAPAVKKGESGAAKASARAARGKGRRKSSVEA